MVWAQTPPLAPPLFKGGGWLSGIQLPSPLIRGEVKRGLFTHLF